MRAEVLRHNLASNRRAAVWWIVGVALFVVLNVASWPAVKGQADYDDLLRNMPDALRALFGIEKGLSLTSPEGFLISQVFGFVLPLLFVVLAVSAGSRAIAAEEEQHTLDLLMAQPISRRRVVLEKLGALVVLTGTVGVAAWVVLVASTALVDLDAGLGDMAVATSATVLFGLQSGALALGVGAAVGRRATAIAVASTVAVVGFVLESLAQVTDVLSPVRWLSPYHYVNGNIPMLHGLRAVDVAVLLGLTAAASVAGLLAFDRRDLTA